MLRVVLCCSLLANVVLSLLFVGEPGRRAPAPEALAPRADASLEPSAGESPERSAAASREHRVRGLGVAARPPRSAYYERLQSAGLSEAEAKSLVLARLEREEAASLAPPPDTYWKSGPEARLAHALAELDADARVRSRLLAIFGPAAERDEAFVRLFRPLYPHFPFLDSGEQLGLLRFRLERQLRNAAAAGGVQSARPEAAPPSGAPAVEEGRGVADVLHGAALFEYELRESPLAARLRAVGADLSEEQFRSAFAILKELERGGGDLRRHLDARAALARLLGPRAYARYWSTADPAFRAVARAAEQHGLSSDATLEAYGLFARHEEQLLAGVAAYGADAAGLAVHVSELRAELERQLTDLAGEAPARALLAARASSRFLAVSGPSAPPHDNELE